MANWQYIGPGDQAPVVPTHKGYYVSYPTPDRNQAAKNHPTIRLTDQDNNFFYIWAHEVVMSFEIGGSYAQSMRFREWYPRNFTQPIASVTGQTATEFEYGKLVEFIHSSQQKSLRWNTSNNQNTVRLTFPHGGELNYAHQGHSLNGHIKNIQRNAVRWTNAPEFTFDFVIATAHAGLFEVKSSDPSGGLSRIAQWMQIPNTIRKGADVVFATDPDVDAVPPNKK